MTVSHTFFVLNDLDCKGVLVSCFVGWPSIVICLIFFFWLDRSYGFWGRRLRDKVPFSSHHIKGTNYQHDLWRLMLILITWLEHFFLSYFHSILYLVLLHTIRTQFTPHPTHTQVQPNKATGHMLGWCSHFKCQKMSNACSQLTCLSHPRPVKVCRLASVHDHTFLCSHIQHRRFQ